MSKKHTQPETKPAEGQGITDAATDVIAAPTPDPLENDLHTARLEATLARDITLLCDGCKDRLQRAHAGDERERNAKYPEGVTP